MSDIAHDEQVHETTGIETRKLAMWIFLSSEFMFFGALISNYLLFKGRPGFPEPYPSEVFDIPFTSVSSFVLLMSSLTMVLADHALHKDDQRSTRTWLVATALLGMVFLAGQVFEFAGFVTEEVPMKLSTNPAASAFFTLTGFHGMHVLVGVIMLLTLVGVSFRKGKLSTATGLNLESVALYWHFVDIIWIVIFTIVYLIK
ncbi:MAG: heme-copper oxidase subunit III [Acidimicrobiia bacterium]|nr:heme-copper oxidase subunit III [Acidimicrobiia bacterium]